AFGSHERSSRMRHQLSKLMKACKGHAIQKEASAKGRFDIVVRL
ncbi:8206_t:CDS:1, partial [Funneliformis mosseae]